MHIHIIHLSRGGSTMIVDRSYKLSAFGDFSDIVPDADIMMFFLEAFKDYGLVPSIFQEVQITPPANQPITNQRIALLSKDGSEQVSISSSRIDYEIKAQNDIKLAPEQLASVNLKIGNCFGAIFEKFNKKSTRLALNTENFVINLNAAEVNQFMLKYSNPISIYNGQPLGEWTTRLMIRKEAMLNGNNESFNIITILAKTGMQKQVDGKTEESTGFTVNVDINTIAENARSRFKKQDMIEFIKIADEWWNLILTEMG